MKILGMDTTNKYLVLGLFDGDTLVASVCKNAWKHQSEELFPQLVNVMEEVGWNADDLDAIVITKGPGSYTGARIAMSVAKVLATTKNIDLYTISTFELIAGDKNALVLLDARAKRAYVGECRNGSLIHEEIVLIEDLKNRNINKEILGDRELLGLEIKEFNEVENFIKVKQVWVKVENVHGLVPHYLKEQEECVK